MANMKTKCCCKKGCPCPDDLDICYSVSWDGDMMGECGCLDIQESPVNVFGNATEPCDWCVGNCDGIDPDLGPYVRLWLQTEDTLVYDACKWYVQIECQVNPLFDNNYWWYEKDYDAGDPTGSYTLAGDTGCPTAPTNVVVGSC